MTFKCILSRLTKPCALHPNTRGLRERPHPRTGLKHVPGTRHNSWSDKGIHVEHDGSNHSCKEPYGRDGTRADSLPRRKKRSSKAKSKNTATAKNQQTHPTPAITGDANATFLSSRTGVSARSRNTTDRVTAAPRATRFMYGNGTAHARTAGRYGPNEYPYMHPSCRGPKKASGGRREEEGCPINIMQLITRRIEPEARATRYRLDLYGETEKEQQGYGLPIFRMPQGATPQPKEHPNQRQDHHSHINFGPISSPMLPQSPSRQKKSRNTSSLRFFLPAQAPPACPSD